MLYRFTLSGFWDIKRDDTSHNSKRSWPEQYNSFKMCGLKPPEILLPPILKLLKLRKTDIEYILKKRKWTAAF